MYLHGEITLSLDNKDDDEIEISFSKDYVQFNASCVEYKKEVFDKLDEISDFIKAINDAVSTPADFYANSITIKIEPDYEAPEKPRKFKVGDKVVYTAKVDGSLNAWYNKGEALTVTGVRDDGVVVCRSIVSGTEQYVEPENLELIN